MAERGHTLSANAVRELRRMDAWYRHFARKEGGGGGPTFPPIPHELRRFELKADLIPGTVAAAYRLTYSSTGATYTTNDSTATFDVYDAGGDKRAIGRDSLTGTTHHGAYGVAWKPHDCSRWEVIDLQRQAKMCYCQAKITSGNTLSVVDNVTPMDGGMSPVTSSTETVNVTTGFETNNNAYGVIAWDENATLWRPLDFPCPST